MDLLSFPSFYLSAPASPGCCSPENVQFYSTRSSPLQHVDYLKTTDDEFEFGIYQEQEYRLPARSNSFSTIAYADELFCNGQVLPLKLPPRLQKSVPTSPRSLSSRIKNPFALQCTWNDDFDPFMIALEKVSEETGGRMSVHRRSRSYSPLRASAISRSVNWDQEQPQHKTPGRDLETNEPNITEMFERKGSMYSRWVRSQTMIKFQTPTARTMMKRMWLGEPVKQLKKPSEQKSCTESKMQRVKSVLLRYASGKKENTETNQKREIMTISNVSYFKRLSRLLKTYRRRKESVISKMAYCKT